MSIVQSYRLHLLRVVRLFLLLFTLCVCAQCAGGEAGADQKTPQPTATASQARWAEGIPSEATILKQAIVSSLAVRSVGENNQSAYDEWIDNVMELLVVFDRLNSPDDLKTFASLSAYYLGESPAGIYGCIAVRKGRALKPYLLVSLRTGQTECTDRFGDTSVYDGLKNSVCWNPKRFVQTLIAEIESGQTCSNAMLANSMGQ